MSWERDPLYAKARLFFERAFDGDRDEPTFGLWCSLGLELLGRAALASVSPTLLAAPDNEHKYLLHALNRGSERTPRKSITAAQVFSLCRTLFSDFTEEDFKAVVALINRRNEELHSGAAAFDEYRQSQWLAGFYRGCRSLSTAMGESLVSLFGEDEASAAIDILTQSQNDVNQRVKSLIAAHCKVFQEKGDKEKKAAKTKAKKLGAQLAVKRHHRVTCPACECVATVQGTPFGKEHISHGDGEIIVRQHVSPTSFSCSACGLKLEGYAELAAANLGGHYTRRTTYSPDEYYGLLDPENLESYMEEYLANLDEYDNE
jgi:transcription elongation factor Elf1